MRGFGAFRVKQRSARIGHTSAYGRDGPGGRKGGTILQGRKRNCAAGSMAVG
jgi:hypothetical protein